MSCDTRKILVVDDIEDWRETLRGMLEDANYEVFVATSVVNATEVLRQHAFDLAIVDMRLDEADEENRDGLKVLARMIKNDYPQMRTIILTGYADQDSLDEAMEPDNDGTALVSLHLEKTETDQLILEVEKLLATKE